MFLYIAGLCFSWDVATVVMRNCFFLENSHEWRDLIILIESFSIQELTEEGLPFLILFHMKEDTESLEIFQNEVARQLISEKGRQIKVFIFFLSLFSFFLPIPFPHYSPRIYM